MSLTVHDAQYFSIVWCCVLILRGPALYIYVVQHDVKNEAIIHWFLYGKTLNEIYGRALSTALWLSILWILFLPRSPFVFAMICCLTAVHQLNRLQKSLSQSYYLVLCSNIALACSCFIAAIRGKSIEAGVNGAAPIIIDAYIILMFFAAFAKFNSTFLYDPTISAATAHVLASMENLAAGLPLTFQNLMKKMVSNTVDYTSIWKALFIAIAIGGAITEALVVLFMYWNKASMQMWTMYLMHLLFALTRFDFSVVVAGIMPLWVMRHPNAVSEWYGVILKAPYRHIILSVLVLSIMKCKKMMQSDKLKIVRMACQFMYIISCPLLMIANVQNQRRSTYDSGEIFLPSGFLFCRRQECNMIHMQVREDLGVFGEKLMQFIAIIVCMAGVMNGLGPYIGLKTLGSYSLLYSNLVVEKTDKMNHLLGSLLWMLGLPYGFSDMVTVIETNALIIQQQLLLVPLAPSNIFESLVSKPEWSRAAKCHNVSGEIAQHIDKSVPGRNDINVLECKYTLPYLIPYFQLRRLISSITSSSPDQDFFVVYEYKGKRMRFERKGKTCTSESDTKLLVQPNPYLIKLRMYRALPVDLRF